MCTGEKYVASCFRLPSHRHHHPPHLHLPWPPASWRYIPCLWPHTLCLRPPFFWIPSSDFSSFIPFQTTYSSDLQIRRVGFDRHRSIYPKNDSVANRASGLFATIKRVSVDLFSSLFSFFSFEKRNQREIGTTSCPKRESKKRISLLYISRSSNGSPRLFL